MSDPAVAMSGPPSIRRYLLWWAAAVIRATFAAIGDGLWILVLLHAASARAR